MTIEDAIQTVIIDKLKASIIANDMVATRALLDSVRFEKNESFGQLSYDIIALDYIVGLDQGVGAYEQPYPTIAALEIWIAAKGLDLNPYAVQQNIIKNGTTWGQVGGSHIVTDSINDAAFNEVLILAMPEIKQGLAKTWQLLFKGQNIDDALQEGFFDNI